MSCGSFWALVEPFALGGLVAGEFLAAAVLAVTAMTGAAEEEEG